MNRPTRRWYECLQSIKPAGEPTRSEIKEGKDAHAQIEFLWPEYKHDLPSVYHDESLPFDIIYHPDMHDEAQQVVYEIKPYWWYWLHVEYCVAQLSGYMHFKQAKGKFILYKIKDGVVTSQTYVDPPYVYGWDRLKEITLASIKVTA